MKLVAIWLSARYRAGKARCRFRDMKSQRRLMLKNTLLIQCAFRIKISKKKARRVREKRWAVVTPYASTIIQRHWRGVLGRKQSSQLRAKMLEHLQDCLQATIRIQSWFRIVLAKRLRLLLQHGRATLELTKLRSCIQIQCIWRTIRAKNLSNRLKREFEEQEKLRIASLSRISALVRCRLFRKAIERKVLVTETRLKASLLIQTWYRNETERVRQRILAEKELAELRLLSANLIQKTIRKKLAHLILLKLRAERAELLQLKESKATVLCRWMRICIAKMRVQQRRAEYQKELTKALVIKIWAATIIASAWRGKLGRDLARTLKMKTLTRWKALFDQREQRAFYYNQDTGESTWTKPQILLDAEPKPNCLNCNNDQADFECLECEEYYCSACWNFIHMGGRRKSHLFRRIYDYYGRRLDYDQEPWLTNKSSH